MMKQNNKKDDFYISSWFLMSIFLIALIVVVGGLTRLTDSGLSITKWDLFSGIFPPISISDWEKYFNLYKQIPEFKLLNSNMSLNEFKFIFWWEYIHRLLGRVIGLFFIIPLIVFTLKKNFSKNILLLNYIIFVLILIQGFVGWYMVQSGLVERTDVSHYRLSLHLTLAFIIFSLLLWNYFNYKYKQEIILKKKIPFYLPVIFLFIVLLQVSVGALVSGLDAAQIYQTWPLMNDNYFPDDSVFKDLFSLNLFNIPSLVQFLHRNIAYLLFLIYLVIFFTVFTDKKFIYLRKITSLLLFFLFLQIFLGILTVIFGAHILIASMHQIGSIFLISASLFLAFKNS